MLKNFWGSKFEYNLPREMAKFSDQIREAGRKYAQANPGALPVDIWARMDNVARSLAHQLIPSTLEEMKTSSPSGLTIANEWGYDYTQDENGNYLVTFVRPRTGPNASRYEGVGPCGDYEPRALLELVPALRGKEICENLYEVRPEELDSVIAGMEAAGIKRVSEYWDVGNRR